MNPLPHVFGGELLHIEESGNHLHFVVKDVERNNTECIFKLDATQHIRVFIVGGVITLSGQGGITDD